MRLAIIDENDKVYVEYSPEVFKELLIRNLRTLSPNDAFDLVVSSLKQLTLRK